MGESRLPEKVEQLLQIAHQSDDHPFSAPLCGGCQKIRELRAAIREAIEEARGQGILEGVKSCRSEHGTASLGDTL